LELESQAILEVILAALLITTHFVRACHIASIRHWYAGRLACEGVACLQKMWHQQRKEWDVHASVDKPLGISLLLTVPHAFSC
jgi:hypothetical protein